MLVAVAACVLLGCVVAPDPSPPIARVKCGLVSGHLDEATGLSIFYGIPYGAPPNGTNRWQPPSPAACWSSSEILSAQTPGNICWQLTGQNPCDSSKLKQDEDCLNLDVYTSNIAGNVSLPVMVWIHGGSLIAGYSEWYGNLQTLATSGKIVLVSINYRLNAFGFLAHEALGVADPRGVSGNYGILDQQAALNWVQENIGGFGGDATSVTLIGQSSGGTSIFALLSSPASAGLFHGAISLSGSPNMTIDLQAAYTQNTPVVEKHCPQKTPADVLQCLLAMSAFDVAAMFPSNFNVEPLLPIQPSGQFYPGLPIIDGVTLTHDLLTALRIGLNDVPLLIQTMQCEMDTFEPNKTIYAMSSAQYAFFLQEYFSNHDWPAGTGASVFEMYSEQANVAVELAYQQWLAEYSFLCGNVQVAIAAGEGFKSPVYLSLIAHGPERPFHVFLDKPPSLFAGHMWDYISAMKAWDWFHRCQSVPAYEPTEGDIEFGELLLNQWLDLAIYHELPSSSGIQTVDSVPGFPTNYNLILQNGTTPEMVLSYASGRCNQFMQAPLNLNQSFWLTN